MERPLEMAQRIAGHAEPDQQSYTTSVDRRYPWRIWNAFGMKVLGDSIGGA